MWVRERGATVDASAVPVVNKLRDALLAKQLNAGDIVVVPHANNAGNTIQCILETVATGDEIVIAACASAVFFATESDEGVTVAYPDDSIMNTLGYEKMTEENRKTQFIGTLCSLGGIALDGYNCWANRDECMEASAKSAAMTIGTGILMTAGKKVAAALTGASCIGLGHGIGSALGWW